MLFAPLNRLAFLCLLPLSAVTAPPVLGDRCQQLARAMIFGGTAGEIMNRFVPANVRAFFEEFAPGSALSVPCLTSNPRFVSLCAYRNLRFRPQSPGDAPKGPKVNSYLAE